MITGEPKTPFFAFKLSPSYRITRVIVEEALTNGYYRISTAGRIYGVELYLSVEDAIKAGRLKIMELERAVSKTQTKINERKASLKMAERDARA